MIVWFIFYENCVYRGYFGQFLIFKVILVIFRFRGYFIHFLGLGGISVSGVHFLRLGGF